MDFCRYLKATLSTSFAWILLIAFLLMFNWIGPLVPAFISVPEPCFACEWTIIHWSVVSIVVWALFITAQASVEEQKAHGKQREK